MGLNDIIPIISLGLNFLLLPLFGYVIRIESRLTRLETDMVHISKREGDRKYG